MRAALAYRGRGRRSLKVDCITGFDDALVLPADIVVQLGLALIGHEVFCLLLVIAYLARPLASARLAS